KGFYLAITTIAAQIMFPLFIIHMPDRVFGGSLGLKMEPARLWGIVFNTDRSLYYLTPIFAERIRYNIFL
ncbi:MAG: hypothetical protein NTX30_00155, partial [Deltaproteobacteria bacterium]|nr:hypothetical protein [Deltaproteobacteria bacterium]